MKHLKKFFEKHRKRKIIIIICLAVLLTLGWIYGSIIWKIHGAMVEVVDPEDVDPKAKKVAIAREEQKDDEVINVLLVGTDTRDPESDMGRSDSMMLVSLNKSDKKATAASFLRDTLVDIDGYGKSRLGHTYAYGGVGLTINTINKTYGLDIQNYITINFENLVAVIDQVGGIDVPFTAEEAEYYKVNGMPNAVEGYNTLTGAQALAYSRNRTLDSDFGRTLRQRNVLFGIYQKVREKQDPATLLSLINFCVTQVTTNMEVNQIYDLATTVLEMGEIDMRQTSVPADGTYQSIEYEGMQVLEVDIEANKKRLEEFMY